MYTPLKLMCNMVHLKILKIDRWLSKLGIFASRNLHVLGLFYLTCAEKRPPTLQKKRHMFHVFLHFPEILTSKFSGASSVIPI